MVPAVPALSNSQYTFAAPIDGGLVIAGVIDTTAEDAWALVFVDVPAAAALAVDVLHKSSLTPRAFTRKFGFPVGNNACRARIDPSRARLR